MDDHIVWCQLCPSGNAHWANTRTRSSLSTTTAAKSCQNCDAVSSSTECAEAYECNFICGDDVMNFQQPKFEVKSQGHKVKESNIYVDT